MRVTIMSLCFLTAFVFAGCSSQTQLLTGGNVVSPYKNLSVMEEGKIVHLPTGREFTEDELIEYLGKHRVVYVGESHDSLDDHAVQLKILKRLSEAFPGKVSLGLEMMKTTYQDKAAKWANGELEEKEFVRVWQENWGNSYPYYADILRYVRDHKIPLIALNRPKSMKHGAAAPDEPTQPEPEIDYDDPYYKAYIDSFFAGHGEGKPEIAKMFMKGQLLWDETMAETAATYLKKPENAGMKLVVFAGGNHVRYGFGMPRRLFRRLPEPYVNVEPWVVKFPEEKEGKLMDVSPPEMPLKIADFAWTVGYHDLEDKLVMLGVMIEPAKPEGVLVKKVMEKSPAHLAGVVDGDVIVDIDGAAIKEIFDLTYEVSRKKVGDKGVITVLRENEKKTLNVTYDVLKHTGQ